MAVGKAEIASMLAGWIIVGVYAHPAARAWVDTETGLFVAVVLVVFFVLFASASAAWLGVRTRAEVRADAPRFAVFGPLGRLRPCSSLVTLRSLLLARWQWHS